MDQNEAPALAPCTFVKFCNSVKLRQPVEFCLLLRDCLYLLIWGAPGMPEWGQLPVPKKLLQQGIGDILRISDARMSGTSYGACVLHVAPEAALGGPLGLVRDGDLIELDVFERRLDLLVEPMELERRRQEWQAPALKHRRGYAALYVEQVTQADEGCDFRFLQGYPGETAEPDIF